MRGRKTIGDTTGTARRTARWIALGVPSFLLGGALISQYVFGLFPCEMCWWQRYPHIAAIMNADLVRCDVAPWSLFGISLAGWNFLFSSAGALIVFALLAKSRRPR